HHEARLLLRARHSALDSLDKLGVCTVLAQEPDVPGEERDLLGQTVVDVAGQPATLLEGRRGDDAGPVGGDLASSPYEQGQIEAEPEDVAGVDPVRERCRMEEIVDV